MYARLSRVLHDHRRLANRESVCAAALAAFEGSRARVKRLMSVNSMLTRVLAAYRDHPAFGLFQREQQQQRK